MTPQQLADMGQPCNCGASDRIRSHSSHREDCCSNQYFYEGRHTIVAKLLRTYLTTTFPDAVVTLEVAMNSGPNPSKMDLVMARGSGTTYIDVTMTNPSCMSNLASERRAAHKRAKYETFPQIRDKDGGDFIPLVIETTGRLGKDALKFPKDTSGMR